MDILSTSTMLQSNEEDVLMGDNEYDLQNELTQNGFMDPRVLNQDEEVDLVEPEERELRGKSEPYSEITEPTTPRPGLLPTGCCYDDRMKLHANADYSANPHHPEDPRRIEAIMAEFRNAGLIYSGTTVDLAEALKNTPNKWMWRIGARKARQDEICTTHSASHFEWVKSLSTKSSAELRDMTDEFDKGRKSIYVGNLTYEAALISAGGAIETCKSVVVGKVKNAIAVIRPPGHHAEANESLGFCIFNNVPVAAKVCMADYPEVCRKVLILDWDVHHGNGIQNIFYEDPNVLYISIHVYGDGSFYPGQPEVDGIPDGGLAMCGAGPGVGKNINIGWTEQGVGDGEYMAAFQRIVMPIATEFNPDLVIVSAGFDAAAGDDIGLCFVTPACYAHMTHMLMSLANGKVAVCLEGGYDLKAISKSALAVAQTLMGQPPEKLNLPPINKDAAGTLDLVQRLQARYWECLRSRDVPFRELKSRGTERLSEMIRRAQRQRLSEKHNMIPLYIQRTSINIVFENQVLVTPEIRLAKKILLIIHDPPDFQVQGEVDGSDPYAHNTFVTDGINNYIDWAVANDFGVVDVYFPQAVAQPTDQDPFLPKSTEAELQMQTKELLCYIWDCYLELSRASIMLMGVGDAYLGIKQLLISRDTRSRISGVLSFVAGSLRPVKSETDTGLSAWYKENSQIYVSPDHACWNDEESARKVRKSRFGRVVKADIEVGRGESGVGRMLKKYENAAAEWMLEMVERWERDNEGADEDESEEEEVVVRSANGTRRNSRDDMKTLKRDGNGVREQGNPNVKMRVLERERDGRSVAGGGGKDDIMSGAGIPQSVRVPVGGGGVSAT